MSPSKIHYEAPRDAAKPGETVVTSTCAHNCGGRCAVNAHVRDGRIVKISTDPRRWTPEMPPLHACVRGFGQLERVNHPDRLMHPLRRTGPRGSGQFQRVSWDDALDEVAREMRRIRDTYGPAAILDCSRTGSLSTLHGRGVSQRFINMFGGCTELWSNLSAEAEIFAVKQTYGAKAEYKSAGREPIDYVNSRLIVMWGWSPGDGTFGTGTMKQAVAPMGECRNDFDICTELARRLGIAGYNDKTEDEWLRELTGGVIDDFDTFRERGLARLPAPDDAVAFAREIRDPERHPFSTPSGKIEIYSMTLAARPDPYGLGAIPPIPMWIEDEIDARYPLRLVTPKSRARTHSIHDNQPILSRADADEVWINTADAAARGIVDGQRVRVFNARGTTHLPARVTDRIAPGVVSIKEGAWFTPDAAGADTRGCANVLIADRTSPAGAAPFNSCFVDIAPALP